MKNITVVYVAFYTVILIVCVTWNGSTEKTLISPSEVEEHDEEAVPGDEDEEEGEEEEDEEEDDVSGEVRNQKGGVLMIDDGSIACFFLT